MAYYHQNTTHNFPPQQTQPLNFQPSTSQHTQNPSSPATPQSSSSYDQRNTFGSQPYPSHTTAGNPSRSQFNNFVDPSYMNPVVQEAAFHYGSSVAAAGKDYVDKNFGKYFSAAKFNYYFAVSNSYVLNKLKLLLFPFRHKSWARRQYNNRMSNLTEYVQPRDDINAPDLYIPTMAFVTYILIYGIALGTKNEFQPDLLGLVCSRTMIWLFVEVGFIYFGFYLLNVSSDIHVLDLFAYCGYKYMGCVVTLLFAMVGVPSFPVIFLCLYFSFAVAYFQIKTLRLVILPDASSNSILSSHNRRRNYFLLFTAAIQIVSSYVLTRVEFGKLPEMDL